MVYFVICSFVFLYFSSSQLTTDCTIIRFKITGVRLKNQRLLHFVRNDSGYSNLRISKLLIYCTLIEYKSQLFKLLLINYSEKFNELLNLLTLKQLLKSHKILPPPTYKLINLFLNSSLIPLAFCKEF
jgi:hypothetical protein